MLINTNGQTSSGVVTYPATILFDSNSNDIYPNMGVSAKIITNVKDEVILIPSAAVQTANGQTTVRVMKDGKVSLVNVETGLTGDTQTEITSGINEGETVVTSVITTTQTSSGSSSPFGGLNRGFGAASSGSVRIQAR